MAKISIKKVFRKGVGLLREGKIEEALKVFEFGINESSKAKDKGPLLYNIAICQLRLGNNELGLESIKKAISHQPWLSRNAEKDDEFSVFYDREEFNNLIKNNKWRFVRTRRWYTGWMLIFYIIGFLSIYLRYRTIGFMGQVSLLGLAFDQAIKFTAMSLFFAWVLGKAIEGIVAFKHEVKKK